MSLPDSYLQKREAVPAYFDGLLAAQPPERFSIRFLENLAFASTNDRLLIGILKDIGFLNRDGVPQPRYFEFLDRSRSKVVLAEGIQEAYSDLFAINTKANELSVEDTKNKLRSLYAGKKTDLVIGRIASTFRALCDYADFSSLSNPRPKVETPAPIPAPDPSSSQDKAPKNPTSPSNLKIAGLQYHINIVLPETRDQAVFDAIFKSLREHLG